MSATDPGLPDAVQRVGEDAQRHIEEHPDCSCGWLYLGDLTWWGHVVEAFTATARSDVSNLIRQAKADALEEFAREHVRHQSPGRMAEDLLEHAAAIRAGRVP